MEPRHFLAASKVLLVVGKGGVGKSTVAAALARLGSAAGLRVALVETDGKPLLPGVPDDVETLALQPGQALTDYLIEHGLARITRRLVDSGIVDLVASAAPGIDDLLVLGKIKHMERAGRHDVIVVDGPAAGHAVDMLRAPRQLRSAVAGGPVRQQAEEVLAMLADPVRCRVMLVTSPESTPVSEMIETAFNLEEDLGVSLAPVVVNGIDDAERIDPARIADDVGAELRAAADYRLVRIASHRRSVDELDRRLPLPRLEIPRHRADGRIGETTELVALVADGLALALGSAR